MRNNKVLIVLLILVVVAIGVWVYFSKFHEAVVTVPTQLSVITPTAINGQNWREETYSTNNSLVGVAVSKNNGQNKTKFLPGHLWTIGFGHLTQPQVDEVWNQFSSYLKSLGEPDVIDAELRIPEKNLIITPISGGKEGSSVDGFVLRSGSQIKLISFASSVCDSGPCSNSFELFISDPVDIDAL